jgi:hypothetical protein
MPGKKNTIVYACCPGNCEIYVGDLCYEREFNLWNKKPYSWLKK